MEPQQPLPREEVYNTTNETSIERKQSPLRLIVTIGAVLLLFLGILWLGEAIGLIAAIIPGGLSLFQGTVWGILGLVGLILIFYVLLTK